MQMAAKQRRAAIPPVAPQSDDPGDSASQPDTHAETSRSTRADVMALDDPNVAATGAALQAALDPALEARLDELLAWKIQQQLDQSVSTGRKQTWTPDVSDSDSDEAVSVVSQQSTARCVPVRSKKKKKTKHESDSSDSESGLSEGDRYRRPKVTSKKVKKQKKKKKKSKKRQSSSSDSSESSFPSSDSDAKAEGVMEKRLAKDSKKKILDAKRSVRVRSLLRTALDGHFDTFKPTEVIGEGAEKYTGIKGVKDSFLREMDPDVILTDQMKRFEHMLLTLQTAILSAMAAIVPVANRMSNEQKFTTLAEGMSDGLELLAAASTFATFRRYENVYKGVTTEAGKEVTRSRRVKDKKGKEFTLFMPPKPIKGKTWDKSLMFGGQLQSLLKRVESGSKCGKQMGTKRKVEDTYKAKKLRLDRAKRGAFRGGRAGFGPSGSSTRGRFQRNSFGWNEFNRPNFGRPATPQGRGQGFNRGGAK